MFVRGLRSSYQKIGLPRHALPFDPHPCRSMAHWIWVHFSYHIMKIIIIRGKKQRLEKIYAIRLIHLINELN